MNGAAWAGGSGVGSSGVGSAGVGGSTVGGAGGSGGGGSGTAGYGPGCPSAANAAGGTARGMVPGMPGMGRIHWSGAVRSVRPGRGMSGPAGRRDRASGGRGLGYRRRARLPGDVAGRGPRPLRQRAVGEIGDRGTTGRRMSVSPGSAAGTEPPVRPRSRRNERFSTQLSGSCQAALTLPVELCGSSTNLRATPESKSAYPCGASSRPMTVAFTASPMCTLSARMAFIRPRWYFITGH